MVRFSAPPAIMNRCSCCFCSFCRTAFRWMLSHPALLHSSVARTRMQQYALGSPGVLHQKTALTCTRSRWRVLCRIQDRSAVRSFDLCDGDESPLYAGFDFGTSGARLTVIDENSRICGGGKHLFPVNTNPSFYELFVGRMGAKNT